DASLGHFCGCGVNKPGKARMPMMRTLPAVAASGVCYTLECRKLSVTFECRGAWCCPDERPVMNEPSTRPRSAGPPPAGQGPCAPSPSASEDTELNEPLTQEGAKPGAANVPAWE